MQFNGIRIVIVCITMACFTLIGADPTLNLLAAELGGNGLVRKLISPQWR